MSVFIKALSLLMDSEKVESFGSQNGNSKGKICEYGPVSGKQKIRRKARI